MFTRKPESENHVELPKEWIESCKKNINSVYEKICTKDNKYFDIFGYIYKEELLLIVSLLENSNISAIPTTIFLSADISEKTNTKKILDIMLDLSGVFFDTFFNANSEDLHNATWQEKVVKKETIYFKVTRENIALSVEANKLLE